MEIIAYICITIFIIQLISITLTDGLTKAAGWLNAIIWVIIALGHYNTLSDVRVELEEQYQTTIEELLDNES
jgi:hypothetical protein